MKNNQTAYTIKLRKWLSLYYLYGYLETRSTWPRGLVVSVSGYEARGPGSIPRCMPSFQCFFFSFLINILGSGYRYEPVSLDYQARDTVPYL